MRITLGTRPSVELGFFTLWSLYGFKETLYTRRTDSHEMIKGICFEDIYTVYCFDEELRTLLRQYIEKAEFFYKDLIGNKFAELKCQTPPYDQHYDVKNYYDKVGITKTLQNFSKEKSYYKDSMTLGSGTVNII